MITTRNPPGPDRLTLSRARGVAAVLLGVVLMQVLFGLSYLDAFHHPQPHGLRIQVAASSRADAAEIAAKLRGTTPGALHPVIASSGVQARRAVLDRTAAAAFVIGADGPSLYVASAGGYTQAQGLTEQFQQQANDEHAALTVRDLAPLPASDARGLSPFYLTLTMVLGGYLGVTVLGLIGDAKISHHVIALRRVGAMGTYALISGIVFAAAAHIAFGWPPRRLIATMGICTLISFATAAASLTLQALLGTVGTAAVILLFVVLGNPSSGGAVSYAFLPTPLRQVGPFIVNGAGVDAIRNTVYFDGHAILRPLMTLATWAVLGSIGVAAIAAGRHKRLATVEIEAAPAPAEAPS